MKLWLAKNNEIPLREQITRQIMLAIASGDLRAGEKLPSVREIALRYRVHPNTVSAAYHRLEENGWVRAKRGSGVFVCSQNFETIEESELDALISVFFSTARRAGFSNEQIETRLRERLFHSPAEQIIIVEPDIELNKILRAEISEIADLPVSVFEKQKISSNAIVVAINESEARRNLPPDVPLLILRLNSVQDSMRGQRRPEIGELIGVASGWEMFLRWANTMLLAAGISAEQIVLRNANETNWQKGLNRCSFVVADSFAAKNLPENLDARVFRLVSNASLAELRSLIS